MNIVLGAVARSEAGTGELKRRALASVQYAERIHGRKLGSSTAAGRAVLYNSDATSGAWAAPVWIESDAGAISLSQPVIARRRVSSNDNYEGVAARIFDGALAECLPNWFAAQLTPDGTLTVASDVFGFGRGYYVETSEWFAASNHLGALAFFLDGELRPDHDAWHLNAAFGWFAGTRTPIEGIRAFPEASLARVRSSGELVWQRDPAFEEALEARAPQVDYEGVIAEFGAIASNIDALTLQTPRVFLSGGQDSRMSAGAWLSSGAAAEVLTYGTLPREAALAEDLMEIAFDKGNVSRDRVSHRVVMPEPKATVSSMEERVSRALARWDADNASNVIGRDVANPHPKARIAIGGMGGEIMHGYFYAKDGVLEAMVDADSAGARLNRLFGHTATAAAVPIVADLIDEQMSFARGLGHDGPSATDLFYLREKYRRWPNSRLNSASVLFLAAPSFVRLAFDLSPEERLRKAAQRRLAGEAIQGWADVPYYKATADDRAHYTKRGLAVWQMDSEYLRSVLASREYWPQYYSTDRIDRFWGEVSSGGGRHAYEAWFHRCIIAEAFPSHLRALREEARRLLSSLGDTEVEAFWKDHSRDGHR